MNHPERCLPLETVRTSDETIETSASVLRSGLSFLRQRWQQVINTVAHANELHVWRRIDRTGTLYWQAYDPITGRSISSGSEADIRAWIEQLYDSK